MGPELEKLREELGTQSIEKIYTVMAQLIESGHFSEAVQRASVLREQYPRNLYFIAYEKRLSAVVEAVARGTSFDDESMRQVKDELLAILRQAKEFHEKHPELHSQPVPPSPGKEQELDQSEAAERQREALQKVINSYLQRADDLMQRGEWDRANQEVRRVYMIDPNNLLAQQYEQRIASARSQVSTEPASASSVAVKAEEERLKPSEPSIVSREEPEKKSSVFPKLALGFLVLLAVAYGAFLFFGKHQNQLSQQAINEQTPSSAPTSQMTSSATQASLKAPEANPALAAAGQVQQEQRSASSPETQTPSQPVKELPKNEGQGKQVPATQPTSTSIKQTASPAPAEQPQTSAPSTQASKSVSETENARGTPAASSQPAVAPPPKPSTPEPEPFIAVEKIPQPVKLARPVYPDIARRVGVQGMVYVRVLVDEHGKPIKAMVLKSDAEVLNSAAIDAAMRSEFTPGIMNNGPVKAWVTIPFKFTINR
ncbi:MAG: TonB family protein [Bacteroidota bacterium]